jgi:hypothetical protein
MTPSGETNITNWVKTLQANPFYAVLSVFIPTHYLYTHPDVNVDYLG